MRKIGIGDRAKRMRLVDIRQKSATMPDADEAPIGFLRVDLPAVPADRYPGLHISGATPGDSQDLAEQERTDQPL